VSNLATSIAFALAIVWLGGCARSRPVPTVSLPEPSASSAQYEVLHKKYVGGVNFFRKGDFANAIRTLTPVWSWDPQYLNISMYLSRACTMSGLEHYANQQYDAAIEMWTRALAVDPSNRKAKRYLKRAKEEARKLSETANS
jgi:tetratricopeptide (TPR) repeat protein